MRPATSDVKEVLNHVFNKESDPEGMSSQEETENLKMRATDN